MMLAAVFALAKIMAFIRAISQRSLVDFAVSWIEANRADRYLMSLPISLKITAAVSASMKLSLF